MAANVIGLGVHPATSATLRLACSAAPSKKAASLRRRPCETTKGNVDSVAAGRPLGTYGYVPRQDEGRYLVTIVVPSAARPQRHPSIVLPPSEPLASAAPEII